MTISPAKERILATAYDLFRVNGVGVVGVDRIIAESTVAKATLYKYFPSKTDLVLAVLARRQEGWLSSLTQQISDSSSDPAERLLVLFDILDIWFRQPDYEGAFYIAVLFEFREQDDPVHQAARRHIAEIENFIRHDAQAAGIRDPDDFARQWLMLMSGAMLTALHGHSDAARCAHEIGGLLLESRLPQTQSSG